MKLLVQVLVLALATTCLWAQTDKPTTTTKSPAAEINASDDISTSSTGQKSDLTTVTGAKAGDDSYRAAGMSDEQIAKMKSLRLKIRDARSSGDNEKVKQLQEERSKIITPEQEKKLKEYFQQTLRQPKTGGEKKDPGSSNE